MKVETNDTHKQNMRELMPLLAYRDVFDLTDDAIIRMYKQCALGDFVTAMSIRFLFETLEYSGLKAEVIDLEPFTEYLSNRVRPLLTKLHCVEKTDYSYISPMREAFVPILKAGQFSRIGLEAAKPIHAHLNRVEPFASLPSDALWRSCVAALAEHVNLVDLIDVLADHVTQQQASTSEDLFLAERRKRIEAVSSKAYEFALDFNSPESTLRVQWEQEHGASIANIIRDTEGIPDEMSHVVQSFVVLVFANTGMIPSSYGVEVLKIIDTGATDG